MAKVTVKNVKKIKLQALKIFDLIVKDEKLLKSLERYVIQRIRAEARLGRSMATGRQLPTLSKSYREYKAGTAHYRNIKGRTVRIEGRDPKFPGIDARFFRANASRSNFTFTGKFLRSLKGNILKSRKFRGAIQIQPTGRRRNGPLNKQILDWLVQLDPDYQILGLDKEGQAGVTSRVVRALRKRLRELRKRRRL